MSHDVNQPDDNRRITTPWGKRIYAAIFTAQLKPSQINNLCKRSALDSMAPVSDRGTKEARLSEDLSLLYEAVQTIKPRCIPSHEQSGLALLRSLVYTPRGRRRRTSWSDEFSERDLITLAHAREIALVEIEYSFGNYRTTAYPIFEVRSAGGTFKYFYRSWQSGSGFAITGRS